MTSRMSRLMTVACVAAATFVTGHAQAATCTDTINTSSALLSNGFAFNSANTRNQVSSINSSNVASLTLAYTHVAEGTIEKKGAPAVTQQTVYFSEGRDIVAANRVNGCEYWRYSGLDKTTPFIGGNAIRSSSVYFLPATLLKPAMVYGGDFYGNFYGVNAKTGALVWKDFVGTDTGRHFITGSPQAYNGTLFIPVATKEVITTVVDLLTACCFSHGMLQAVDPYTGQVKWTYHTSADAKYNANTGTRGPNGMSLWGTPLIDAANGSIIIGTGQNLSLPATTNSDSIIALNINTGAVKWVYQSTAGDAWNAACQAPSGLDSHCSRPEGGDFDFGAPPILATLPNGTKAIIAGAKNGGVYSLNPKTGTLNWSRRIGTGGSLGGIHWGMAVDTKNVYAAVTDIWVNKIQRLSIADLLDLQAAIGDNMGPVPNAKPGLYALDLSTGNLVWEKHLTHDYQGTQYATLFSAALSVTNDVLLAGSLNGEVKAFRTSNGEELWSYNTVVGVVDVNGVAGTGGTIDSVGAVPAGKDLFVNSGYGSFGGRNPWQAGEGNALFVFRLP
ncbi:PQQ-binding-like beta-propeller repeat protein [Aquabacterium sp.]|uniref:outer membrane protein assembly factor BamB family protein n=1 Tax=Aquabacterium sp. TaxID=1872578 RepID=UPI0019C3C62B|nr:PQQ-binding-like beta-propeller repeat protein [Aquabacterium sp.]MBC7701033.1 PQQ-binding-like beta-propeller repeat protein [Aquabacterium sp.]